ncbi:MAG: hypothetical protein OEV88_18480, partial [Gammaproteobacteria bacterium]|nr:hypothetical protein [Gammaproteobacteria bacterium]
RLEGLWTDTAQVGISAFSIIAAGYFSCQQPLEVEIRQGQVFLQLFPTPPVPRYFFQHIYWVAREFCGYFL